MRLRSHRKKSSWAALQLSRRRYLWAMLSGSCEAVLCSRPSCQRISSVVGAFSIDAFSLAKRCALIVLPQNPYRGMLFNYLHSMLDEISLESALSDLTQIKSALTPKIKKQLSMLAYNRGIVGMRRLMLGYVQSRDYFHQPIVEADLDLNKNLSLVQKILKLEPEKRKILKRSKVRNMTFAEYAIINDVTYLSNMAAARDFVRRNLGNSCGEL